MAASSRLRGFDDKFIAMYARSMMVRELQAFLQTLYGTEVSTKKSPGGLTPMPYAQQLTANAVTLTSDSKAQCY